jgi:hypothetical protein
MPVRITVLPYVLLERLVNRRLGLAENYYQRVSEVQFTSMDSLLNKITHQTHFGIGWALLMCPSGSTRMSGTKSGTL